MKQLSEIFRVTAGYLHQGDRPQDQPFARSRMRGRSGTAMTTYSVARRRSCPQSRQWGMTPLATPCCIGMKRRNLTHQSNFLDGILVGIGNGGRDQKLSNFNNKKGERIPPWSTADPRIYRHILGIFSLFAVLVGSAAVSFLCNRGSRKRVPITFGR